ncbi:MAG: ABC transporter substrate-binding protein [Thermoanaerobaculia bacterium]|nr:ABC transporter substrate-binding protein [Thermoanaerobaculia bacterium]
MSVKQQRERQVWMLVGSSVVLFTLLTMLFGPDSFGERILSIFFAAFSVGAPSAIFLWRRHQWKGERGQSAVLLGRVASGDLAFYADDIRRTGMTSEIASATRALVVNLERTVSRFAQMSADVRVASDHLIEQARNLSRATTGQTSSIEATSSSLREIDQSVQNVRQSMDALSASAEETSTAATQMFASIQEASGTADALSEFAEQTAASVEEMIASLNEVARNTEELSSMAVETSSSILQMSATTEEIARSAKESAEFSELATEAAEQGRAAMEGTVQGMTEIESAVGEVRTAVGDLGARSKEIGEIVRVIEDIARQTNLLALNAAIIAAQAGEHGTAFAVVADEIRDLSQRTSKSTDEIRSIIQRVQASVGQTVNQMTVTAQRVTNGVALAAGAEVTLESIIDLAKQAALSATDIARATEEQIRGSRGAARAIEMVAGMVQQTAQATAQQSDTSRAIGRQAETVRDYTKTLKRALSEEESGSQSINLAIGSMMSAIGTVSESTTSLAAESAAIVMAMGGVEQGAKETGRAVASMNRTSATLRQGAGVLQAELKRFTLPTPKPGGVIRTATVLPDKLTLDPLFQASMAANVIQKAIHETLVRYGEGAELLPGLAEKWEILDDGRAYRFHLRRRAKFHNGRPVTSRDVEASFLRLMSPKHKSGGRYLVQDIRGAREVIEGRAERAEGFVIRDDQIFDLVVDNAPAFFVMLLTLTKTAIVPVEEARDLERFRLHPIGAGPYKVVEAVEGSHVLLRRNEHFYDQDRPRLAEIRFRLDFSNTREFADAFLRGDLDVAHRVPLNLVAELKDDPRYAPYLGDTIFQHTSYLGFDCTTPPFNRIEVRQAMNYAIDRGRINEKIFAGLGFPAKSLLPPGLPGYDDELQGYAFDPERARTLLRSAGVAAGFQVEYWAHPQDEGMNTGVVPLIIENLAHVGIRVEVVQTTRDRVDAAMEKPGHNQIFVRNWFGDIPDPDNFFWNFFHPSSTVIPGINYREPEVVSLIDKARQTIDMEERAEMYRKLNARVLRDAPIVPLFHERFFILHRPEIREMRPCLVTPPVRYDKLWVDQ